jgi:hypothetical protein
MRAEVIVDANSENYADDCLTVILLADCDTERLLLRHLDCSTPTFTLNEQGELRANLRMEKG